MENRTQNEITRIPVCKVSPNSVILYDELYGYVKHKRDPLYLCSADGSMVPIRNENLKNNKHAGFISDKACNNLRKAIKLMFWLCGVFSVKNNKIQSNSFKKISLLTLTLSGRQRQPDNEIKNKMLNQFFVEIRKYNHNLIYVWRAEKQHNGNIHFHILINIYLPLDLITKIWNRIQFKEGYIDDYHEKHKNLTFIDYVYMYPAKSNKQLTDRRKAFIKNQKNNWLQPNSVDIHSLKNIKKSYSYISKYLSKNEFTEKNESLKSGTISPESFFEWKRLNSIDGRIWFASEKISSINIESEMIGPSIEKEIKQLYDDPEVKKKDFDFVNVICISAERLFNLGCKKLFSLFIKAIPIPNIMYNLI